MSMILRLYFLAPYTSHTPDTSASAFIYYTDFAIAAARQCYLLYNGGYNGLRHIK